VPDLAVGGASGPGEEPPQGTVYFLRGQDGREIYRLAPGLPWSGFGGNLAVLSDLDQDGVRDLAISATGYPLWGFWGAGWVGLHSGRTGKLLWSQTGQDFNHYAAFGVYFSGDHLGETLANAGDADGDGLDDLLVWSDRLGAAGDDFGRATLCSGQSGEVLAAYESEANHSEFGSVLSGLGDLDGDGRAEFIIAAPEYPDLLDAPPEVPQPYFSLGRLYVLGYRPEAQAFIRSDTDLDGDIDLTDGVVILLHLFAGGPAPCEEAMDTNRNHLVNMSDAIYVFRHLFAGGAAPQPPYPRCGRLETFSGRFPCERSGGAP
jgi:hypothetical protein